MNVTVGTLLSRPDGKTASVTFVSELEVTIEVNEWIAPDESVEYQHTWTGPLYDIANCWNIVG